MLWGNISKKKKKKRKPSSLEKEKWDAIFF